MAAECYHIHQIKEGARGIIRLKPEARREVNLLRDQLQAHPDDPELKAQLAVALKMPHTNGCYTGQNTPQSNIRNWVERKPDRSGWRPPHIDFSIPNPKDQFFVRKCNDLCDCPCAFARGAGARKSKSDHRIRREQAQKAQNAEIRKLRRDNARLNLAHAADMSRIAELSERQDEERITDRAIIAAQAARIKELESQNAALRMRTGVSMIATR